MSVADGLYVVCQLCNREFKRITHFHTEYKHDMTMDEYRAKFPDAPTKGLSWVKSQAKGHIGHLAWNRGLDKSDPRVACYAQSLTGREFSPEHCRHISETKRRKCQNPEYAKKVAANINTHVRKKRPNKPERKLLGLLDKHFPGDWAYVGDGKLVLGNLTPDFMNVNGEKQLIELYGDYWHRDDDPQERINIFRGFGFSTLVIWERELRDEPAVVERLKAFISESKQEVMSR